MILRLLVAAVDTVAGATGMPTEYFASESERDSNQVASQAIYFTQTGQYLTGEMLTFWSENGGVNVFGFPVSGEAEQDGLTVQYFERAVLDLNADNLSAGRIQLRLLGVDAAAPRYRQGSAFKPDQSQYAGLGTYFPETGHSVSATFEDYWNRNGGVSVFGFPISSECVSNGVPLQYFERAILEYHPDNPSEWRILQPLLGYDAALNDGVDTSARPPDGQSLVYEPGLLGMGGPGDDDSTVYLTFDDGPNPQWTPQILDILRDHQAQATFFVLGELAGSHPDLIAGIVNEGHVIANHGYDHRSMVGMNLHEFNNQIHMTENAAGVDITACMRPSPTGQWTATQWGVPMRLAMMWRSGILILGTGNDQAPRSSPIG
ncbi:MAG: polysaccharide deacetylase family protein [Thermomicrobiaceae bacterium]